MFAYRSIQARGQLQAEEGPGSMWQWRRTGSVLHLGGVCSCSCVFGCNGALLGTGCYRFSFVRVLWRLRAAAALVCGSDFQLVLGALSSWPYPPAARSSAEQGPSLAVHRRH